MKFPVLWLSFVSVYVWAGIGKVICIAWHFYAKVVEKKDYDRIKYEMGSNQLVTVSDYNRITNVHFSDNLSAADIISRYTSPRKGFMY